MVIQSMLGSWDRLSGAGARVPSRLAQQLAEQELCHSFNTLNISYKVGSDWVVWMGGGLVVTGGCHGWYLGG